MNISDSLIPYAASDVLASLIPLDFYTTKMRYLEALTKGTPFVLYHRHRQGVTELGVSFDHHRGVIQ